MSKSASSNRILSELAYPRGRASPYDAIHVDFLLKAAEWELSSDNVPQQPSFNWATFSTDLTFATSNPNPRVTLAPRAQNE